MSFTLPNTAHWQPALEGDGFVEDIEDILQCVDTILRTPKGSVPLRPDFGSLLHLYVDHPINQARPHLVRESFEPIKKYEPRVTMKSIQFALKGDSNVVAMPQLELANGVIIGREVLVK